MVNKLKESTLISHKKWTYLNLWVWVFVRNNLDQIYFEYCWKALRKILAKINIAGDVESVLWCWGDECATAKYF